MTKKGMSRSNIIYDYKVITKSSIEQINEEIKKWGEKGWEINVSVNSHPRQYQRPPASDKESGVAFGRWVTRYWVELRKEVGINASKN